MHFDFHILSPTLSQNFRGTFAKMPLSADPSHQQGAHQRENKHQGPWCLALAKPHLWKLGCCVWSLFLETSESNVRQYQRQVQGCASRPWYLAVAKPHPQKLGCYLWREGKCAVPFSCRTPGRYTMIMIHNIQLSRNFRKKNISRTPPKKLSRGFPA